MSGVRPRHFTLSRQGRLDRQAWLIRCAYVLLTRHYTEMGANELSLTYLPSKREKEERIGY